MQRGWNATRTNHEDHEREDGECRTTTAINADTGVGSRSGHAVPRFERFRSRRSRGRRSRGPPPCREPPPPDPLRRLSHQGGGVSTVTGWGRRIGRQQRNGGERRGAAQGVGENERARRTLGERCRATKRTKRKDGRGRWKRQPRSRPRGRTDEERQGLANREGQGSFGMIVKAERVSATRRAKIQERSDNEGRNECQRKGMKRAIYEEYSLKSQDQVGSCEWNTCTVSHLSEKFIVSEIS